MQVDIRRRSAAPSSCRLIRFWGRHLLLLNVALFGLVWLLYGDLALRGYGEAYAARANDFWLENGSALFRSVPGIENVLLPAIAAIVRLALTSSGFEYTTNTFLVIAVIPYALFIWGVTRAVSRRGPSGRVMAVATALAVCTSGLVPYMTTWGGYADGFSYLAMLPVFVRPDSLLVYTAAFLVQCLNHYLGAIALVIFACVWHTLRAIDRTDPWRYWVRACAPRIAVSVIILAGFVWFWQTTFPAESRQRWTVLEEKWLEPEATLEEVLLRFPWTLLSALKLTIVPVVALMFAPLPRRGVRALALAMPFVVATALTFLFLDITRVVTMIVMPSLLVTIYAASATSTPPAQRRRIRRLLIATALLNLAIPNYYVNNAEIRVPASQVMRSMLRP